MATGSITKESLPRLGEKIKAIGLGILFMVIALFVQEIFQDLPLFGYLALNGFNINLLSEYANLELSYPLEFGIYLGLVAAIMQELSTYIAVDTRKRLLAFFIGLGFSVVDIVVLLIDTIPSGLSRLTGLAAAVVILNVVSSILFHPGTATFMKWGRITGIGGVTLAISIALHTVLDGGVAFLDLYIVRHPGQYHLDVIIFWIIAISISILIFIVGTKKIRSLTIEEKPEKPVVF